MNPLDPDPKIRYEALAALRSKRPVHQLAEGRFLTVDHQATDSGLRSITEFGGSAGQRGLSEDDTTISGILEPRHGAIRKILNSVVAVHKSQRIEQYLTDFIARHLDRLLASAGAGPVDVMPTFVEPIPPAAMARLLGFPEQDSTRYFAWGSQLGVAFGRAAVEGHPISMREGCPEMAMYVEERIAERLSLPSNSWPNDALTRFLMTSVEGATLSTRAITTQIMFAIGAGSDTTRNVLGSMLYRLALDPDLYAKVRADRSLIGPSIEETLRIDPPAQFLMRQCLLPSVQLGGTNILEGDSVMLSIAAANRDESVFPDPDRFDPTRPNLRLHLGFGTGPHICPGGALARLEMRLAMNAWCERVERFSVAADFEWKPPATPMLHGPGNLPLRIHPAL